MDDAPVELSIDDLQRRLLALATDPPFRFRGNTRAEVDLYFRRITTFVGYDEVEVEAAERRLLGAFPTLFRAFLLRMGKAHADLFRGSDLLRLDELEKFSEDARALMQTSGARSVLPDRAVVFLFHQGYTFLYVVADGQADGTVWTYLEGEPAPTVAADSFGRFLEEELRSMEDLARLQREDGGCYVTVADGRIVQEVHPARASGDRPLDGPQRYRRWWTFWR